MSGSHREHYQLDYHETLDQFSEFIESSPGAIGRINLAGGEPFLYDKFENLVTAINSRKRLRYSILSNGTSITKDHLTLLQHCRPVFVQVSIDGTETTHDSLRGAGAYRKAVQGLHTLASHDIPTIVSFTAFSGNYLEFPHIVDLARRTGAKKIWTDRLIPAGHGTHLFDQSLTARQNRTYLQLIKLQQAKLFLFHPFSSLIIGSNRALQFLPFIDTPYSCSAGRNLLALLVNGDLLACRRLPIPLGNISTDQFADIYSVHPKVKQLHETDISGCEQCLFRHSCRGGLKCLAHAVYGSVTIADPGCWRTRKPPQPFNT